jgi:hypothetical protein
MGRVGPRRERGIGAEAPRRHEKENRRFRRHLFGCAHGSMSFRWARSESGAQAAADMSFRCAASQFCHIIQ